MNDDFNDGGDPLFVGMTRPAMLFGVTYSGIIINAMFVSVFFITSDDFWPFVWGIPIHGAMVLLCRWEPRYFDILSVWANTKGQAKSRFYWKGASYRP